MSHRNTRIEAFEICKFVRVLPDERRQPAQYCLALRDIHSRPWSLKKAPRAARTARSTVAASASATSLTGSSVVGLMTGNGIRRVRRKKRVVDEGRDAAAHRELRQRLVEDRLIHRRRLQERFRPGDGIRAD